MLNRVAKIKIGVLEDVQVELKAHESIGWTASGDLIHQGALANERWLIKVNEAIEADLIGRDGEARVSRGA